MVKEIFDQSRHLDRIVNQRHETQGIGHVVQQVGLVQLAHLVLVAPGNTRGLVGCIVGHGSKLERVVLQRDFPPLELVEQGHPAEELVQVEPLGQWVDADPGREEQELVGRAHSLRFQCIEGVTQRYRSAIGEAADQEGFLANCPTQMAGRQVGHGQPIFHCHREQATGLNAVTGQSWTQDHEALVSIDLGHRTHAIGRVEHAVEEKNAAA